MMKMKKNLVVVMAIVCVSGLVGQTEYFLSVDGDDAGDGRSIGGAFATLQRGVDVLEPGDVLTILPGEYLGSARRVGIGSDAVETVIRAAIPGTVKIRGDVAAPEFRLEPGYEFVYAADFDGEVQGVTEIDNLHPLRPGVFVEDLEMTPGLFFHDAERGRLYLSTSDRRSASNYRYTVSVVGDHGLWLRNATRVVIDGLDFVGFQQPGEAIQRDLTGRVTYGLFIVDGTECIIRNCRAYFNNRGIGVSARVEENGRNLIENCVAWGNRRNGFGWGGGLTLLVPWHCEIRDSLAFRNDGIGVLIYQSGSDGQSVRNVAWGNSTDMQLKSKDAAGYRVVGVGSWGSDSRGRILRHSLVGRIIGAGERFSDNIILQDLSQPLESRDYRDLRAENEFVDAFNHDYRLQSTSRFIGAASDGSDLGPFPFEANVYFVSPQGDDRSDGLSIGGAWQTLERAASELSAGDTLYLLSGTYTGRLTLAGLGDDGAGAPLRIRGHGQGRPLLADGMLLTDCFDLEVERIDFDSEVTVSGGADVLFRNCRFAGAERALSLSTTEAVTVDHCEFAAGQGPRLAATGSRSLFLHGNLFDDSAGVAIEVDDPDAFIFADYNSYLYGSGTVAVVGGGAVAAAALPRNWERHGSFGRRGDGLYARRAGVFVMDPPVFSMEVKPEVHSVTATTANFIWRSSVPGAYTVAWGKDEGDLQQQDVVGEYTVSFSLTGLEPSTTYHFRLVSGDVLTSAHEGLEEEGGALVVDATLLAFTTAATDPAPREFFVSPDGNNSNSGLSLEQAWSSVNHAATRVGPGDTVWVAEGVYSERVLVRASGTPQAPIAFRAIPGHRVVFDSQRLLTGFFVVDYKDAIHIDGFRFSGMVRIGSNRIFPGAAVRARRADNLNISRCIVDGRTVIYSGSLAAVFDSANVTISDSVQIDNMSRLLIVDCPDFTIENCIFMRPKISPITIINRPGQEITIRDTLFTDSLPGKANSRLIEVGRHETLTLDNVGLYFRRPAAERVLFGIYGEVAYNRAAEAFGMSGMDDDPDHAEIEEEVLWVTAVDWFDTYATQEGGFIEGNPGFALVTANQEEATESVINSRERRPTTEYFDWMIGTQLRRGGVFEFSDFFLTHPEFTQRRIGLRPEMFVDWE